MKLIYIANIRLPTEKAHGLQIMKTCEALKNQEIDVELVVPRRKNYLKDGTFDFYGIPKDLFKITYLRCWDLVSLGKLGFWIESWTFYREARKYLKKFPVDAYYTRDLPLTYWLSKKFSPVYYEIHTLPDKVSSKYKKTWNRCKGFVVISEGLKNELLRYSIDESKILIARDAVDLQEFTKRESKEECRNKLNLSIQQKIVVYTGHLYGWKGAVTLAEAARILAKDIHVYIVGGTNEDLQKFKQAYNYDNLHIVGWQKHEIIPYWLKAADILVLPTSAKEKIGAVYTSPMKLFEYMMAERPIVASDIPSLREVLDNSIAFFFRPDDPVSLAATLKKIAMNYSEAEAKAAKAYKGVAEKYTWKNRAINIKNFICQK